MSREEEFKQCTDYIRSFANNSIIKSRINQALNRVVFISRQKGVESKLTPLKKQIQNLHNDLSHVDESNWNEAVIDALGRLRKMKNLITNLEDNE